MPQLEDCFVFKTIHNKKIYVPKTKYQPNSNIEGFDLKWCQPGSTFMIKSYWLNYGGTVTRLNDEIKNFELEPKDFIITNLTD